jgi:peroxiredoxin
MVAADVTSPGVGEPAPPLALMDLEGRLVDLAELRGRAVLVSFLRHAG